MRLLFGFVILSVSSTLLFRFIPPPITPLMVIRAAQGIAEGKRSTLLYNWQPLENISPAMVRAVIAAEDQKFPRHFGFDFDAMTKAYAHNRDGGRQRGGSTISQQTAKNIFLWPGGSYLRKGIEAYFTVLLELLWDKERIIETYLNVAEFGPGIYGVESAARRYYHTSAKNLNTRQATMLAAILPSPLRLSPTRPTAYLAQRQRWILQQMRNAAPLRLD
jgi:monofunctional biosynthetic peptidoglycan transglycosylase